MRIQFYDMDEDKVIKELEFKTFSEAKEFAEYIDNIGVNIEFSDYSHSIKYDPIQNTIMFYINID